jgi:phage-related protein
MIYFNGTALESVAPVKIDDIRVSPIELTALASPRAIRFGADFVRMAGGVRTVDIVFALLTDDQTLRQYQLMEITKWARSDAPGRLTTGYHGDTYLECICTALPAPSTRQWWENRLVITFTAFDNPYWTSIEQKSAACGTAFYVGGGALPLMEIRNTFASTASNQSYSDGTNTMTFSSIPAGNMVIDLNRQTAAVGTASIMPYYSFSSAFIQPKTGTQTITGTGTVYWRERWE